MKKILCFALAVCFCLLCGCSSTETQKTNSADTEQSQSKLPDNNSSTVDPDTIIGEPHSSNSGKPPQTNVIDLMSALSPTNSAYPLDDSDMIRGNKAYTDFAVKLFQKGLSDKGENTLISPLSAIYALGLTANGAGGNTLSQMETVFGLSIDELNEYLYSYAFKKAHNDAAKLSIANSIWFVNDPERLSVKKDFLQKNANYYNATANMADFSSPLTLDAINGWVNEKTDGMIPSILDEIKPEHVMFLINALAFEAEWVRPYSKESVGEGDFTLENGNTVKVDYMRSSEDIYLEDDMATGFMKYYKGGYAFVALLPNEGVKIEEYVSSLSGEKVSALLKNKKYYEVNASLPKFEAEYSIGMVEIFKSLGMTDAFEGYTADFSKMADGVGLHIGSIKQKTFISVGEKGTKAGAATIVAIEDEGCPAEIKTVYLNRPFVYMLIDTKTNTPFFIGTLMNVK